MDHTRPTKWMSHSLARQCRLSTLRPHSATFGDQPDVDVLVIPEITWCSLLPSLCLLCSLQLEGPTPIPVPTFGNPELTLDSERPSSKSFPILQYAVFLFSFLQLNSLQIKSFQPQKKKKQNNKKKASPNQMWSVLPINALGLGLSSFCAFCYDILKAMPCHCISYLTQCPEERRLNKYLNNGRAMFSRHSQVVS
jgi:hypothetical protein